jgi:hypothetical protein
MKLVEGGVAMQISLHGGACGWGHFHLSTFAEQRWRRKWRGKTTTTNTQKWIEWRKGKWVCITTTPLPYFCWVYKIPHLFLSSQQEGWLMIIITHPFHWIFCSWIQQSPRICNFPHPANMNSRRRCSGAVGGAMRDKSFGHWKAEVCVCVCVCACWVFQTLGILIIKLLVCLFELFVPTYLPIYLCTYLPLQTY